MRIAIMIDLFGGGGKERRCLQMIKGLNEHGYDDIHLILIDNVVDYPTLYDCEVKIHVIGRNSRFDFGMVSRIYQLLKTLQPDVIMSWTVIKMSLILAIVKPFIKCKYVSAIVTAAKGYPRFSFPNWVKRVAFIQADVIVGNSQAGLSRYKSPHNKSLCIYNGFDFNRLRLLSPVQNVRKELGITTPYIVSMAARIEPSKDYGMYIRAAINILQKRNDITFLCIGKGKDCYVESLLHTIPKNLRGNIRFLGFRKNVDSILNTSDVSVLCTNNKIHLEGVSNTLLESMAYGVPVIGTSGGGTDELIVDGQTGFLIEPYNDVQLAEKINYLLDNSSIRQTMGESAHKRVEKYFSLDRMVRQYIDLFSKISCDVKHS